MNNFVRGAVLALGLSLTAVACGDDASESEAADTTIADTAESSDSSDAMADTGTIVDVAADAGSFTTLLAAAEAAGLVDTLNGDDPLTVFAPTDDAFATALADLGLTAEELLASDDLAGILTYHVVSGSVPAADVVGLDGESVATVNGATVDVAVADGAVMVNDANVVTTDIMASNGVIHVIDKVLLP